MRSILMAGPLLLAAVPALAQAPSISGIFPPGGAPGSVVQSAVAGANLADVQSVLISGSGVKVEKDAGGSAAACPVRLTIEPGAEVGLREIRVVTKSGASNAGRIWVGGYPSVLEKEPNEALSQPQVVQKTPVTLCGRSDKAEDLDHYAFDAGAGETWVFSLNAARHLSALDGFLTLFDARGRVQDSAMDSFGRDPRLIHTFKKAGRYVLQVRDTLYRGGPGSTYMLTLGRLPVVTRWSPLGGPRGATITVALQGVNLGETSTVQVALPEDASRESVRVVPGTPLGPANAIELFPSPSAEIVEKEPNPDPKAPTHLGTVPAVASGCIDRQGDRDTFAFQTREKQPVLLDVHARRLGSRLDPVLRVLDGTGKELMNNDDGVGKDSRLTFTPPAAGVYFAEVRSLSSRGGDAYFYRLELRDPPPPDFSLRVTPDSLTAPAGAAVAVTVTAQRQGYNGEIALRLDGLPPGVSASPAVLRQGQTSAILTLSAPPDGAARHRAGELPAPPHPAEPGAHARHGDPRLRSRTRAAVHPEDRGPRGGSEGRPEAGADRHGHAHCELQGEHRRRCTRAPRERQGECAHDQRRQDRG
jgi:hypothetical protein